ncbi:MAG: nitroreductase family protein [Alphaproteobacteria bacterium]|nr:nitroreductase family protein [Alphaproteobacteria bacterium]
MPSRRRFLQLSAAMPVAAVLASAAGCAPAADPAAAWRDPGQGEADIRRFALAWAILAPNPHNKQPWLVQLLGDDRILLRADLARLLPETDPFDRQIVLGFGAFLELLEMAAASKGWRVETRLWPEGEPAPRLDARPVAEVRFVRDPGVRADPLFAQALTRRTNRAPYDRNRTVAAADLEALAAAARPGVTAGSTAAPDAVAALRPIVLEGYRIEAETPGPYRENVEAMRIGAAEVARYRDGISLTGPVIEAGRLLGLVSREDFLRPDSFARDEFAKGGDAWAETSMAFAWLVTPGDSRTDQIAAGRAYLRLNLLATRQGLALQPWSQVLQEYPAMRDAYLRIHRTLGIAPPARLQMLVRLGHAETPPPAPRRGLAAHIVA